MRKRFLISAALLMASTGFAAAQGTGPGGATSAPSSPPQQSAPAEKMAPAEKPAPSTAKDAPAGANPKATQSDTMSPKAGEMKKDTTAPKKADTKTPAATDQKTGAGDMKKDTSSPKNADTKSSTSTSDQKAGAKAGDAKSSSDTKSGDSKPSTADSKGAAGAAPPPEKQSQISSAIKSEKVEEVTNVNFNISIGTVVPSTVRYYPLPSRIIEIYPEWRGYEFILVRGRYIILRPRTHEIVYIIEG
jgi:hypothetical protein